MKRFIYIWEYYVKEKYIFKFIELYNPHGEWVQLFRKGKGFIKTEFYQDPDNPTRFITIDYWESKQLKDQFRMDHSEDYEIMDRKCAGLTEDERFFGDFNEV